MRPGLATKALRISRPSSVRTGMFCRLGSVEDMRPVAVIFWLKLVYTLPFLRSASRPSTNVLLSFERNLYSRTSFTMGCLSSSASNTSASVE